MGDLSVPPTWPMDLDFIEEKMTILRAIAPVLDNMSDDERHATLLVLGGGGALAALAIAGTLVDATARRKVFEVKDRLPVDLTNFRCDGRVCLKFLCRNDHYSHRKLIHNSKLHIPTCQVFGTASTGNKPSLPLPPNTRASRYLLYFIFRHATHETYVV